jgi:hypothetical protein
VGVLGAVVLEGCEVSDADADADPDGDGDTLDGDSRDVSGETGGASARAYPAAPQDTPTQAITGKPNPKRASGS